MQISPQKREDGLGPEESYGETFLSGSGRSDVNKILPGDTEQMDRRRQSIKTGVH